MNNPLLRLKCLQSINRIGPRGWGTCVCVEERARAHTHTHTHDVGQHFRAQHWQVTHKTTENKHTSSESLKYWSHLLARLQNSWKRLLALSCQSILPSVIPIVRMEQLGSLWKNFREIWYPRNFLFRKHALKIHASLKYGKNKRYFTCKPTQMCNISLNYS